MIKKHSLVVGTINVHALKGFGFVSVVGMDKDVFIPKKFLKNAIDGDEVEVEILMISSKGPEGRIVTILQRSRTHLGCTVIEKINGGYLAYAPMLGKQKTVFILPQKEKLKYGDRIVCQVTDWESTDDRVEAKFVRSIGPISDPSCDISAAIEEFELLHGFTKEAICEAESFSKKVTARGRVNLTHLECVTIDPDTAKDYDDAISLTTDSKGHFFLGVHIADVAAYVSEGSHLDQNAYNHCNSTYFPGKCLPMLPPELSNDLCSLKPKVNRLTVSVLVELDPTGEVVDYQIVRSCIQSKKRFTYKQAFTLLQSRKNNPHLALLERMTELCRLLKQKRMERGSIDFALADSVVIVDKLGAPQRIEKVEYDITHQMIEEFMLKANELVAIHLHKSGKELIYRIHDEPSSETFEDFFTYARALGFMLPAKPSHKDIQKLFENAKDSILSSQLSVSFIRSMKLAFYSPENIGHYGLALEHYCHFTSPIRRYTDLVIQRLLFEKKTSKIDLSKVAEICSNKERISCKAEQSVVLLKKLRLAQKCFKQNPKQGYFAIVTRIKPFAIFFEISMFDLEGSIHVSELGNDYFEYNAKRLSFYGRRTGKIFSCGTTLFVRIQTIDLIHQQVQWEILNTP